METVGLTLSSFMQENIQARDRSTRILAAAAASFGCAFTCNANKSELTIGYCTLYGDESGFLAALADLWKYQVYALGHYLNQHIFATEVIPAENFTLIPSAELSADQDVDAGKGDPLIYPYHDYLFRAFVERWQRATPEDLLKWYIERSVENNMAASQDWLTRSFQLRALFINDLERWWKLYTGMGVAKRIQGAASTGHQSASFSDLIIAKPKIRYTSSHCYLELKERLLNS